MEQHVVEVDPSNDEQLAAWDGDEGAYWAAHAEQFDRSIAGHHRPFMAAAEIARDARILDIGCGTGQTTRDAARLAPAGSAVGIDLSSRMLAHARQMAEAEGLANISFVRGDAQRHRFPSSSFDVAMGRTSAMFFGDHAAAFANVRSALRTGGRLVLLTWQPLERNEWLAAIATSLAAGRAPKIPPPGAGPFSLSDADRVEALLTSAGFTDVRLTGNDARMCFGADSEEAHAFILGLTGWMLEGLDDDGRRSASDALRATVEAHESDDGVTFASGTWIVTAVAG